MTTTNTAQAKTPAGELLEEMPPRPEYFLAWADKIMYFSEKQYNAVRQALSWAHLIQAGEAELIEKLPKRNMIDDLVDDAIAGLRERNGIATPEGTGE